MAAVLGAEGEEAVGAPGPMYSSIAVELDAWSFSAAVAVVLVASLSTCPRALSCVLSSFAVERFA